MEVNLIQSDTNGGKITSEKIDLIANCDEVSNLKISGLHQDTLEYLINNYARKIHKIELFKCPKVEDLSPLEDLISAKVIVVWWNQKAKTLWDVSKNKCLKKLQLTDLQKVHNLDELSNSTTIENIHIQSGMWKANLYETIEPISSIKNLTSFGFAANIQDNRIEPISKIEKLQELWLPPKQFKMEQLTWLKAKLPSSVKSDVLAPFKENADLGDVVLFNGKRKPFVNRIQHPDKFRKLIKKFEDSYNFYLKNQDAIEPI
ncbi:hypothetical protein [Colwellia sp. RSH04]|uniref:hypothetical protein n=1 Tax=Colwellia sp. RSH04 TaxID=2305464 RepID=UPI000E58B755|nr:hypothetical protein [Colwellia sp. RSH04]RHW75238.1 hypothetical protein D1094_14015 [Colwellia sp. RSH04]